MLEGDQPRSQSGNQTHLPLNLYKLCAICICKSVSTGTSIFLIRQFFSNPDGFRSQRKLKVKVCCWGCFVFVGRPKNPLILNQQRGLRSSVTRSRTLRSQVPKLFDILTLPCTKAKLKACGGGATANTIASYQRVLGFYPSSQQVFFPLNSISIFLEECYLLRAFTRLPLPYNWLPSKVQNKLKITSKRCYLA